MQLESSLTCPSCDASLRGLASFARIELICRRRRESEFSISDLPVVTKIPLARRLGLLNTRPDRTRG